MGVYLWTDQSYYPNANTVAYYTFDDQNVNQITDVTGKNTLLYGEGNKITYSQLSGTDYYGNFNKSRYAKENSGVSNYSWVFYIKISNTGSQYIMNNAGIDLIYGFNSGQIEVYDYYGGNTYRSTIKSSTPLNTWMCIGFTKNGTTVTKYYNGSNVGTATFADYQLTIIGMGGTSSQGFNGSLNNIILEDRVRTDADMLAYFNKSKGAYGIS